MAYERIITLHTKDSPNDSVFTFALAEPAYVAPATWETGAEITGLLGTRGIRRVSGHDGLGALHNGMLLLSAVANCLPVWHQADASAFSTSGLPGIGFPELPDLQFGMKLYMRGEFEEAIPLLLPYASKGVGEIQLAVGSAFYLWMPGDPATATIAFSWCERASRQGIGQAFKYMAEIVDRYPEHLNAYVEQRGAYLDVARSLGFPVSNKD